MEPTPAGSGGSFKFPNFWETKEKSSPSPHYEPRARDNTKIISPTKDMRAVISPLFKVLRDGEVQSEKAMMGEPVGIAALITAAEEKSKEREAVDVRVV